MIMRTLMLASLAVVAMVSTVVVDGAMVTKCEVKDHIEAMLSKIPPAMQEQMTITVGKLTAMITCHVELTSGFNTSAVNQVTVPDVRGPPPPGRRGRRSPLRSKFDLAMKMGSSSSHSSSSSSSSEEPTEAPADVWTLYGLFQLPGRVMCDSGMGTSLNLCEMDCSKLVDDNIDDDIECAESLKAKMMMGQHKEAMALIKKVHMMLFQRECMAVNYDEYFAECS